MAVAPLDPAVLPRLAGGFRLSQLVYVTAALGLADLLREGPRSASELAAATRTHERSLARLLRALASEGMLAYDPVEDLYASTAFAEGLASDGEGSWRAMVLGWSCLPAKYDAFAGLLENVRTGRSSFEVREGMRFYEYLAQHADAAAAYDAATGSTIEAFTSVAAGYDYSRINTIVDVGGGQGMLLAALLTAYPSMRGVLLDLPSVVAAAETVLADAGVADRVEIVASDMFSAIPAGGDAYIFATVFRCFSDDACLQILERCREALPAHGCLLAVEMVPPEAPGTPPPDSLTSTR